MRARGGRGLEGASARAEEVVAARELPVISEGHTYSYSAQLKADGREAAAALMDVDDDEDLVQLEGRFEGKVLFENDAGQDKTWKVLAVQYDERTIRGKFQGTSKRRSYNWREMRAGVGRFQRVAMPTVKFGIASSMASSCWT